MKGYKTWIGAGIMAASAFFKAIPEYEALAEPIMIFGLAVLGVGLGHKIEKNKFTR